MSPATRFIRRMRNRRLAANLSQRELADRMKAMGLALHQASISRIEAGTQELSLNEALALAALFGDRVEDMVIEGVTPIDENLARVTRERDEAVAELQRLRPELDRLRTALARIRFAVNATGGQP
jgi:transcriptional regulator with XRE-family HTH domain